MSPPLLKLALVKGPREGETLEYKPGSTIRIGRVVRGNEIAIKDAGISTKHLRIVSDSENWILHDLGSSNGTVLNSESLDPNTPVALRHGDEIKLGECTSIVVNFETDVKVPPRPRRNNRPTRKGRSAKQEEPNAEPCHDLGLNSIKLETEDTPKGAEISSAMKRATRSRRQIGNVKSEEDTGLEEMRRPSRATRSKRKEIGGDSFLDLDVVLSQARAKKKKKKSVVEEMEARNEDVEEDGKEDDASKRVEEVGKSRLGGEDGVETSEGECDDDEEEKAEQECRNVEKVDVEKMTLGDWFKYMEVYLRKKIVDETEEMIEGMRAKSRRVHQYIADQKQAQGALALM